MSRSPIDISDASAPPPGAATISSDPAPGALAVLGRDGALGVAGSAWGSLLGLSDEARRADSSAWLSCLEAGARERLLAHLADPSAAERAFELQTSDGAALHVSLCFDPAEPGRWLSWWRTVSTEALECREKRWRLALEASGDGVWDWWVGTSKVFRTDEWRRMLGYSAREAEDLAWRELVHVEDRFEVHRRLAACLKGRAPSYEAEFRVRGRDGEYRWLAARGKVVERAPDGSPRRMLGTYWDSHEPRERLARMEASERRWQFALEGHGDALWDWNLASGEILVTPAFRRILGWPIDKPLGGSDIWPGRLHREDLQAAVLAFNEHLSGERDHVETEFRLRTASGAYRWVALRGKIMESDPRGRPLRLIGTVRDVHAQYLDAEREKRQQREIDQAGRLMHIGEMASALAHELNQPLTALRNFSAVALHRLERLGPVGVPIREPLKMISEQALRAGEIVHRVRGMVKTGRGAPAPVSLNEVVRDMVRLAEADARTHRVQISLMLHESLPCVAADQPLLEQVLANLIRNGIEAMQCVSGERRLSISTRIAADGEVELSVIDGGEGYPQEALGDPFSPFVTTKPDGAGLGLAICRTIIEGHGGRMWLESVPGGGSVFSFSLPGVPAE